MSVNANAIATELDVKNLIDDGRVMPNFIPTEYTLKCVTKSRLLGLAYVNENNLSSLLNNQLVRYDLITAMFTVSIIDGIAYPKNGGTYSHTVSAGYTWSVSNEFLWFYVTPAGGNNGTTNIDLVIVARTTTSYEERSGTLTFTETTTGNQIIYTIIQRGVDIPDYEPITLYGGPGQGSVCEATFNAVYYIAYGENLFSATELFSDADGTIKAVAGEYRQEVGGWREWDGNAFINSGSCLP